MNLDQACVLVKEIVIGKRWNAGLRAGPNSVSVWVDMDGAGSVLRNEIEELVKSRTTSQWYDGQMYHAY